MILRQDDQPGTHSAPVKIAREINIDRRPVSCIIDQDLDLRLLMKPTVVRKLIKSSVPSFPSVDGIPYFQK